VSPAPAHARPADLDAPTLHAILRLRAQVFVVEQACAFLDPDGRDLEATTVHWWLEEGGELVSYLRVLDEGAGGHRIGRVATAAKARRRRLAEQLLRAALGTIPGRCVLDAQTPLVAWYERLGFVVDGTETVEDGIAHTPMVLGS